MKRFWKINIFTGFLTLFSGLLTTNANPGIRLRFTDKGLQLVDTVAIQLLNEKVKTATIPDISGDADTPVGHISYSLSSVHFNSLSIPSSTFKTDPGVGLTLQISNAQVSLSGNWHYRKDHWPHISDSGSFDLDASGLALSVSAKLGADSTGHPTIATSSCSSSVGDVNIHFHGGASWLYNLFDSYVAGKIKDTLQDKLCQEVSEVINNNAEKELSTFPVKKQIDRYALINYSLVSSPVFNESYLDVFIKGEFQSATDPKEAPFSPVSLPTDSESAKMAYVWLTDYVFNTAGLVYQDAGFLNETVTPSMLPPNFSYPLNTSTFKLIIPKVMDTVAIQLLNEKVKTATIPDISGDADTPVGHISYSLSSVHFNSLSIPSSTFKTDPGVGLTLQISNAQVSLSGNWHYRKDHWPHISDSGSFDLDASGLALSVSAKLGADSTGHPTIATSSCSSSVGDVNIHFHGGASWLYNLFDSYVAGKIKDTLQDKLCQEVSEVINNNAEKELSTFPVKKQIDRYALINYSLVSSPVFNESYLDVFIKGEFQSATDPKEAPFSPVSLPTDSESAKMAYVWLTDYVFNTAGLVYQDAGFLNETVTPSMLPPNFSYPLNTSTFKLIIPKLYLMYPNRPMKLVAHSTLRPTVTTSSSGIALTMTGQVETYAQLENGSFVYTFTMGLNISASVKVAVRQTNVTGHVDSVKVKVSLIKSAIGDISINMKLLQFALDAFADQIIAKQLNKIGDVGFPLPVVDGVQLVNAEVTPGKGFNLIATDVKYSPGKSDATDNRPRGRNKIVIV